MLIRDAGSGIEVYLTRRSARSSFVPDAYVFPGGAVEAQDRSESIAARLTRPVHNAALAIAAMRELFEEAGILLAVTENGTNAVVSDAWRVDARAALLAGTQFEHILRDAGLFLDAGNLHAYSNWVTPVGEPIRFDTHFFTSLAPPDQIAQADAREVHDGRWLQPQEALRKAAAGEMTIIFPTRKHLERIAAATDAADFVERSRRRRFTPLVAVSLGTEFGLPQGVVDW